MGFKSGRHRERHLDLTDGHVRALVEVASGNVEDLDRPHVRGLVVARAVGVRRVFHRHEDQIVLEADAADQRIGRAFGHV